MASDPVRRGTGAATAVITEAHRIAAEAGAELIWCQARETAQSFYERAGWRATGDLFESVGVPHRNMSRDL